MSFNNVVDHMSFELLEIMLQGKIDVDSMIISGGALCICKRQTTIVSSRILLPFDEIYQGFVNDFCDI